MRNINNFKNKIIEEKDITFSICMATFNGEKFLNEQITTIISQLDKKDELIISDDCSSDSTIDIVKSFNDKRIKIYKNNKNVGFIKNFEKALSKATKKWILLADQDDIWLNYKIELFKSIIYYKSDIGAIFSNHFILNENKKLSNKTFYDDLPSKIYIPYLNCHAHGPGIAFRTNLLKKILPFPKELKSHDQWIGQLTSLITKVYISRIPTQIYRKHSDQFTHRIKRKLIKKFLSRFFMLKNLISRIYFEN